MLQSRMKILLQKVVFPHHDKHNDCKGHTTKHQIVATANHPTSTVSGHQKPGVQERAVMAGDLTGSSLP